TRGARERRSIPFSSLFDPTSDPGEPSVDPSRFAGPDARGGYRWTSPPQPWDELPEARLDSQETLASIRDAIEALPASQREVITLRDVDGWTPAEVCTVLQITDANQRVLLHRARSKVRRALERYLDQSEQRA